MTARRKPNEVNTSSSRRPPATTPEGRERQLISLAVDLTEKQLREGTASAQVITHYLKLGSTREALEQERLRGDVELTKAKIQQMASVERIEELYSAAIAAMRRYGGSTLKDEDDGYQED